MSAARRLCIDAISRATTIAIASHAKPDGDAVGSCLALKRLLDAAGKRARIAGLAPLPARYAGFPRDGDLETAAAVLSGGGPDLLITADASSLDRIPEALRTVRGTIPILNLDHHADNTRFGTVNLVDPAASSTGELVYLLAKAARYPLDREVADFLWIALVTDTGRFAHENTTPRTMRVGAELLALGVSTEEIDGRLYRSFAPAELELQKRVLQSLEFHAGGKVAFARLARNDFAAAGAGPEAVNDLVDIPRSAAGVDVAVLFYEDETLAGVKVSMRSNAPYDVGALCREFGGGGHARAAGCTLTCSMPEAAGTILERLSRAWFGSGPERSERT